VILLLKAAQLVQVWILFALQRALWSVAGSLLPVEDLLALAPFARLAQQAPE
jgi:hypothetical protein